MLLILLRAIITLDPLQGSMAVRHVLTLVSLPLLIYLVELLHLFSTRVSLVREHSGDNI